MEDKRVNNQILPGRADAGNLDIGVFQLFFDPPLRFVGVEAPEMRGVSYLHTVIVDEQVHRVFLPFP